VSVGVGAAQRGVELLVLDPAACLYSWSADEEILCWQQS
jgi:hypothetical protein